MRRKTKKIISIVLAGILLIGAIAGVSTIFKKNDQVSISPTVFSIGGLNEDGTYLETKETLYTKETISCIGLRLEPEFDSNFVYDVYYYDQDMRLVETVEGLIGVYDEDFPLAQYCRIVIHPEIPEDFEGDEFEIKFYEVLGIANKLKIFVNRDQTFKYGDCVNLYVEADALQNTTFTDDGVRQGSVVATETRDGHKVSNEIELSNKYKKVDIYIRCEQKAHSAACGVVVTSADQKVLTTSWFNINDMIAGEWCKFTIDLPETEEARSLYIRLQSSVECQVFGY